MFFLRGALRSNVAARGCSLKKKGWRGVGGEGAAPPPQMHSASLQPLKKKAGGGLGERAQRLPPDAVGVFAFVVFSVYIFCLLLVFFLRGALRSNVAVRGCNLKKKGWRGVGGCFSFGVQTSGEYISTMFGCI